MLNLSPQRSTFLLRLAAGLALLFVLAYAGLNLALPGLAGARTTLSQGLIIAVGLLAAGGLALAAATTRDRRRGWLPWVLLAAAQLSAALGDGARLAAGINQVPAPLLAEVFYGLYYLLFILAVVLLPAAPASLGDRLKLLLDIGLLLLAAALVLGAYWMGSGLETGPLAGRLAFALAYPLADLALVVALALLLLRRVAGTEPALWVLALSLLVLLVTDMALGLALLQGTYLPGGWLDIGWIVGYALTGLAGVVQAAAPEGFPGRLTWLRGRSASFRVLALYLPYLLLVSAYLFLLWGRARLVSLSSAAVALVVAGLTLLVLLRQFITLLEHRRQLQTEHSRREADAVLLDLSQQLLGAASEDDVAACAARIAAAALRTQYSLVLLPSHPGRLTVRAGSGWPAGALPSLSLGADEAAGSEPAPELLAEGAESGLSVPMQVDGRVTGALLVYSRTPRRFSDDDARLLALIANQCAAALDKARLFEVSRRQIDELTVLHAVASASATAVGEDDLIARVTRIVGETLFSSALGVMLVEADTGLLRSHPSYQGDNSIVLPLGQGVTGHVALTGQPARVDDVSTDPRFVAAEPGIHSELCVPLTAGDRVIGVINVESPRLAAFSESDERLLLTIARQLSTALERLRLFDRVLQTELQRAGELEAVRQAGLGLTASLDLQTVLQAILQSTLHLLPGAQDAYIFLYHPTLAGGRLSFGAAHARAQPPDPWEPRAEGFTYSVARQGEMVLVGDSRQHPLFTSAPPEWGGAFAGVPLKIGARVVGVMNVAYPAARAFPESEVRILRLLGDQAAIAIENARLFEAERAAREQAEALREVAATLNASLDRERLLRLILEQLARVVAYDSASVMLFSGERLSVVAHSGFRSPNQADFIVPVADYQHIAQVVERRQPVIIADTRTDPRWRALAGAGYIRSWLGAPLIAQGRVLGLLNLDKTTPNFYTERDADLAVAFANQSAAAIETARLFEIERRQLSLAQILQSVGALLTAQMSLDEVFENIFDLLAQVVAYDSVSVQLLTTDGGMALAAGRGFPDVELARENVRFVAEQRGVEQWLDTPVLVIPHTQSDSRWIPNPHTDYIQSWIGAALLVKGQLVGILTTDSATPYAYDAVTGETVRAFANQAAVAIENARLFEASQRQTRVLSGLYDTALATGSVLETDVLLARWQAHVRQLLNPDTFVVAFYHADTEEMEVALAVEAGQAAGDIFPAGRVPVTHSFLGWVTRHRQSLLLDDLLADSLPVPPRPAGRPARSWLGVPLISRDRVIGAASVQSFQPAAFDQADGRFLELVARQVAIAIENARLYNEVSVRAAELGRLYSAAQDLGARLDPNAVLQQLARHLTDAVAATSGYVLEVNLASETMTVLGEYWAADAPPEERQVGVGRIYRLAEHPIATRAVSRLVVVQVQHDDPSLSPREAEEFNAFGIKTAVIVPIVSRGAVLGVAELWESRRARVFDVSERRLLQTLCQHAAGVIENARLFAATRQNADEVTAASQVLHLLNAADDVLAAFPHIAALVKSITGCERVSLAMLDDQQAHFTIAALDQPRRELPQGARFLVAATAAGPDVLAGRLHLTPSLEAETAYASERSLYEAGYRSRLSLPLRVGARVIGAMNLVWFEPFGYVRANLPLLSQLADAVALAIEKTRLFEATRRRDQILEALAFASGRLLIASEAGEAMPDLLAQLGRAAEASRAFLAENLPGPDGELAAAVRFAWSAPGEPLPSSLAAWHNQPYRAVGLARWLDVLGSGGTLAGLVRDLPPAERERFAAEGVQSLAVVPIFSGAEWWGWLCVDDRQAERAWLGAELEGLKSAASALGAFLTRQRTEAAEREQRALAEALRDTAAALNSTLDLDEVLDRILADVGRVVPHTSANVMLLEDGVARIVRNRDQLGRFPQAAMLALRYEVAGVPNLNHMFTTGQPAIIHDSQAFPGWQDRAENRHIRSVVGAPIQMRGAVIGFITLDSTEPGFFAPAHAERLQAFAHQAGLAIENAQLYASIRRHADELEQRVLERTRELDEANRGLRELDHLKDQFISNVSHELRTPLTNIKLHLGLLERRGPDVLARYLPTLQRETERLRRLIEDLLDLSRLQTQPDSVQREPQPLDDLIAEVITLHAARAETKGLELRHDPNPALPPVPVDRAKLTQVFTNLVGNAVAYTPPGGHAVVSTTYDSASQLPGVAVHFYNDGPTIPPEDRPHLFRRFYRGRTAHDSGEPGTGLGLAICHEIVERHGGRINVESDAVHGTTFTVWLPLT